MREQTEWSGVVLSGMAEDLLGAVYASRQPVGA